MRRSAIVKSRKSGFKTPYRVPGAGAGASKSGAPPAKKKATAAAVKSSVGKSSSAAASKGSGTVRAAGRTTILKRQRLHKISYKSSAGVGGKSSSNNTSGSGGKGKRGGIQYGAGAEYVSDGEAEERYFTCLYTKRSNKKHKTYDDGVCVVKGRVVKLFDKEAKQLAKTNSYSVKNLEDLHEGNTLEVGSKELEIVRQATAEEYHTGALFIGDGGPAKPVTDVFKRSKRTAKKFKGHKGALAEKRVEVRLEPRWRLDTPDALVLFEPPANVGCQQVGVAVDPYLAKRLRPHQRDGVKFMFECVMGLRDIAGTGCILADEMGLGKTLQAITLIWTMLKTGPQGKPAAKKVLVVTPTSLMRNWMHEFRRWLGPQRVQPTTVAGAKNKAEVLRVLESFKQVAKQQVLVISYEQVRAHKKLIASIPFGLALLDEGHRIKNVNAQISKALNGISTRRRVILTGTPLQNNLNEFYAMVEFCNPGALGSAKFFSEFFVKPIMMSRDVSMSEERQELGEMKFQELSKKTAAFMLRRTNIILEKYLPPKTEQVVFCKPSQTQCDLYRFFLQSKEVISMVSRGATVDALGCMQNLVKLCNYPGLVYEKVQDSVRALQEEEEEVAFGASSVSALYPEHFDPQGLSVELSGKMVVLDEMLTYLKGETTDRVVVVSNFVQTLDLVEVLCKMRRWTFCRLDGQTNQKKRQELVDRFNRPNSDRFVFLLSSKAGGVGLNLIGANRLVLFDSDWNPAIDRQAMARVWRDGQKKRVYLYRFLTTGTIDEKIFQRQLSKEGLSSSVLSSAFSKVQFAKRDLKDIFSLNTYTACETHDLICPCWFNSEEGQGQKKKNATAGGKFDISKWSHICEPSALADVALKQVKEDVISAVFRMDTNGEMYKPKDVDEEEEEGADGDVEELSADDKENDGEERIEVIEEDDDGGDVEVKQEKAEQHEEEKETPGSGEKRKRSTRAASKKVTFKEEEGDEEDEEEWNMDLDEEEEDEFL